MEEDIRMQLIHISKDIVVDVVTGQFPKEVEAYLWEIAIRIDNIATDMPIEKNV